METKNNRLAPPMIALVSVALFAGTYIVPILALNIVFIVFCPLPLFWAYLKGGASSGRQGALMASVAVLGISFFTHGIWAGIPYLFFVALAVGASEIYARGFSRLYMLLAGALLAGLVNVGYFVLLAWSHGQGVIAYWKALWLGAANAMMAYYGQAGVGSAELDMISQTMYTVVDVLCHLAVALTVVNYLVITWINLFMLNRMAVAKGLKFNYQRLHTWRAPDKLAWVLIFSAVMVWLGGGFLYWLGLNILLLCATVYVFQGLSVAAYFCDLKNVPLWARVLMLTVMIFMIYLAAAIAFIGLFDTWFDWRKLNQGQKDNPGGI